MNWSEMSLAQRIAGIAGVVLVVNLFLPWYSFGPFSANAFEDPASPLAFLGSLLAIGAAVLLLLPLFGQKSPNMGSLQGPQIALLVGALGFILIILRWLTESSFTAIGLYLGILASAAVGYAAFAAMKDAGLSMPTADDFRSSGGGGDGSE